MIRQIDLDRRIERPALGGWLDPSFVIDREIIPKRMSRSSRNVYWPKSRTSGFDPHDRLTFDYVSLLLKHDVHFSPPIYHIFNELFLKILLHFFYVIYIMKFVSFESLRVFVMSSFCRYISLKNSYYHITYRIALKLLTKRSYNLLAYII